MISMLITPSGQVQVLGFYIPSSRPWASKMTPNRKDELTYVLAEPREGSRDIFESIGLEGARA